MPRVVNTAGAGSESAEQKALVQWWGMMRQHLAPTAVLHSIPNGGRRDIATGARLKAEGAVAGIPDLFLACARSGRHGLYIEMKKAKGGRVSESQRGLFPLLESQGYGVAVCHGWREAASCIEAYLAGRWEASHV
jgi:hypothetical protein